MCESLGRRNPQRRSESKGYLVAQGRSARKDRGAVLALRIDLVSCGAARAHTLGPERW